MKSEIDTLANELIQKQEEYEAKCKSDYKKNVDLECFDALVESNWKILNYFKN